MKRLIVGACAAGLSVLCAVGPTPIEARDSRALPMQFELRTEGPAEACDPKCRTWVSASGAITPDTARDFDAFTRNNDVRGLTVALDSDGGSVLGALALGRSVRSMGLNTTVGRSIDAGPSSGLLRRSKLMPRATCESMCAFVLLGGVERQVPPEAGVLVHQIWLGDRREDPTSAKYSAEDLVLVQRDIGRLVQYTVEMGGGIDLLETSLRIPPWEPMRVLSRSEMRSMKIVTRDAGPDLEARPAIVSPVVASGPRAIVGERSWVMADQDGNPVLVRKHPLTVEGDDIGAFELRFACGPTLQDYRVTYTESRRSTRPDLAPEPLTDIQLSMGGRSIVLSIESSRTGSRPAELVSVASGSVPAQLVDTFSDSRARSLMVETSSADIATAVRVGNAGISRNFPQFSSNCRGDVISGVRVPRGELRREAEAQPRP